MDSIKTFGGWQRITAVAGVLAATAALGVGIAADGPGAAPTAATVAPACTEVVVPPDPDLVAQPWLPGLLARSDGLNRLYGLGRFAPGEECAQFAGRLAAADTPRGEELLRERSLWKARAGR